MGFSFSFYNFSLKKNFALLGKFRFLKKALFETMKLMLACVKISLGEEAECRLYHEGNQILNRKV